MGLPAVLFALLMAAALGLHAAMASSAARQQTNLWMQKVAALPVFLAFTTEIEKD